ncbi:MAG: NAD(+)/NADH kinase [Proteobacteria bacterium]|nr:NAD(+)/NADH kinase [Pseudomonadota bacterium]MBU1715218.1 NAD(+)/NADH kinase [Pseudomonadota bacterium]
MLIKKAGIILKKESSEPRRIGEELVDWFTAKSINAVVDEITPDMDILVILGGDGTLLHVADQASRYGIPVVGVNLGDLGFLTEVVVKDRYEALEKIMAGSVVIENRLMLKVRLKSKDDESSWQYALNDVVISKGNVDRLVELSTWADDEYITTYKADGLIFSTPTGSTAYNLSAGGPIVRPDLHAILVTPICPFMLESRPVLLPHTTRLATKVAGPVNDVKIIVDGRSAWDMREDDILEVRAAGNPLRLICSPQKGYFEILRSKLNWGGRANCILTADGQTKS